MVVDGYVFGGQVFGHSDESGSNVGPVLVVFEELEHARYRLAVDGAVDYSRRVVQTEPAVDE